MFKNKKLLAVIGAAVLVFVLAGAVYAAAVLTPEQQKELNALHQQLAADRKQIVQKQVEFGLITAEQGKQLTERIDAWAEQVADCDGTFQGRGFGGGRGRGRGMGMGMGRRASQDT